ncbi:hypothetical protein SALB1_0691 [Salinisphaera sp. LB1]|nr:hypothetical protein SALB1_0691 [Salinisphaera sp. LB1]
MGSAGTDHDVYTCTITIVSSSARRTRTVERCPWASPAR